MPYRRLPNTDNARYKALQIALEKGKELPPFNLSFSQQTYRRIIGFMSQYEKALIYYKKTFNNQVQKNQEYLQALKKARLYVSHFFQVLNMAIIRGELSASNRKFFGISENDNRVPALNTEAALIEWGEKLIKGETARKMQNLAPVNNPTVAMVKVRFEQFLEAYKFQKTLQTDNKRAQDNLAALRAEADDIILNIWNEVEATYKNFPDEVARTKAIEYGVVYVYRRNELRRITIPETSQLSIF